MMRGKDLPKKHFCNVILKVKFNFFKLGYCTTLKGTYVTSDKVLPQDTCDLGHRGALNSAAKLLEKDTVTIMQQSTHEDRIELKRLAFTVLLWLRAMDSQEALLHLIQDILIVAILSTEHLSCHSSGNAAFVSTADFLVEVRKKLEKVKYSKNSEGDELRKDVDKGINILTCLTNGHRNLSDLFSPRMT